jgi:2-polyprenyl-3-methyl-5-hydroxy-6-metoxy-1,4-benzoquinol methylase
MAEYNISSVKMIKGNNCPACGSNKVCGGHILYDDRYGYPGQFLLKKCRHCSHKFNADRLETSEAQTLYQRYYPRSAVPMDRKPVKHRLQRGLTGWLNGEKSGAYAWVPKNVRILDIGCGFGETIAFHKERGCDAVGIEVDENVEPWARKHNLNIRIGYFEAKDFERESFDYVTMDQVFEHVEDPFDTLTGVYSILKPDGRLVISTPNAAGWGATLFRKRWVNWHIPYHNHFPSKRSMRLIAERTGFSLLRMKTVTRSEWFTYQLAHLVSYPGEGRAAYFWDRTRSRAGYLKRLLHKTVVASQYLMIGHVLTRCFDTLGMGDNWVIVLKKTQ